MTARRYVHIACDGGLCQAAYPVVPERYATFGQVSRTIAAIRRDAQAHGWQTRKGNGHTGQDLCPRCHRSPGEPMWP